MRLPGGRRITTRFFDLANTAVQLATSGARVTIETVTSATERRELLKGSTRRQACVRCPLHQTRTTVVFGAGNADADLMFVGEAPGANEDRLGLPFVGQAGKLLDKLLVEIGLERGDVFIANTLKCLRYNAAVQLADGNWERIGRLVRSRYSGGVMSVDAYGHLVSPSCDRLARNTAGRSPLVWIQLQRRRRTLGRGDVSVSS